ncbi:MAG TPA: CDGSH iron-sulfur domain-containing protein [Kofleriaceae bacterium]|jgi:CDGSH-type Zn-finger protein/uncharacterized Fe-S cluster protein YjdI
MGKEDVRGALAVIHFDSKRCIHSRHCVLDRPDVFVPNVAGEWIHPDAARPDEVLELAHNCPSGAITCERLDGGPEEHAPIVNTVRIRENGPLAFHGELVIAGEAQFRATLCRCGQSQNKPYCDGAHNAAHFAASGEPDTETSEPLAARAGAVTITPAENGPLLVSGNLEVVTGTGRTIDRCTKTAFCRCGHSHTKPFCDGSHKLAGFTAPGS